MLGRFFGFFLFWTSGAFGAPTSTATCSSGLDCRGQVGTDTDRGLLQASVKSQGVEALTEDDEHETEADQEEEEEQQIEADQREAVVARYAHEEALTEDDGHKTEADQEAPDEPSDTIPNSNRQGGYPCKCTKPDCEGEECTYKCSGDDYVAIGKHVYREEYKSSSGETLLKAGFYGGRCEKLCEGSSTCGPGEVKSRSMEGKKCMMSTCYKPVQTPSIGSGSAEDEALLDLARGNWALWLMGRSTKSGLYVDNINSQFKPAFKSGKADVTGCGLIMECIAVSMGFQSKATAQEKVLQTLKALAGELPEIDKMRRSDIGKFWPGIMNTDDGAYKNRKSGGVGNTVATGLMFGGILFAKTYFQRNFPDDPLTKEIAKYAVELWESVEWDKMVCKNNKVNPKEGDQVAWDVWPDGKCDNPAKIRSQKIQFNEAYVGRWFAYEWACNVKKTDSCKNLQKIWNAVQKVKQKPLKWKNEASETYTKSQEILSKWGSYVVQLPYYMANSFNADKKFQELFHTSWQAEKDYYTHAPYYAPDRYGLGAGPTSKWCAGTGYIADKLGVDPGCLTYSPHGTVGYLATKDPAVKTNVLKLLEDGETVTLVEDPITKKKHPILDRRMLLDSKWLPYAMTMIDMAGELFGLGAYFLGNEFFTENTDFFDNPKAPWV